MRFAAERTKAFCTAPAAISAASWRRTSSSMPGPGMSVRLAAAMVALRGSETVVVLIHPPPEG